MLAQRSVAYLKIKHTRENIEDKSLNVNDVAEEVVNKPRHYVGLTRSTDHSVVWHIEQCEMHGMYSMVCGVPQASQSKLMNMNFFRVHSASSQSPHHNSSLLKSPSSTFSQCSSAIFTCKYSGRWVGSWGGQLGNINYICMWFEHEQGLVGAALQQ